MKFLSKYKIFVLAFLALASCRDNEVKLATCAEPATGQNLSVTFNREKKIFSVSGQLQRKMDPDPTVKLVKVNESFPVYGKMTSLKLSEYFSGFSDSCRGLSIGAIDPELKEWKACDNAMSKLSWMAKYTAGKSGPRTPENDRIVKNNHDDIRKFCPAFDGKFTGVDIWFSFPESNCDQVGLLPSEYGLPYLDRHVYRFGSLLKSKTVACEFNTKAINSLIQELN